MVCIFCQIVSGEINSEILYQDDEIMAFRDIQPQAPVHLLIIPKKHFASLNEPGVNELPILSKIADVARKLAIKEGIAEKGYRIAINCGQEGKQSVSHLHMHLLGGRQLSGKLG